LCRHGRIQISCKGYGCAFEGFKALPIKKPRTIYDAIDNAAAAHGIAIARDILRNNL